MKKEGGWDSYKENTNKSNAIENIIAKSTNDVDKLSKGIEAFMKNAKFKSFGKVTLKASSAEEREVMRIQKEKNELIEKVNKENPNDLEEKIPEIN